MDNEIRCGQVWKSADPRESNSSSFTVEAIWYDQVSKQHYALTSKNRKIRLDRFQKNSRGYVRIK